MNQIPNIEEEIVNLREWWELQSIIDAIQTGRPIHKPDIDFLEKLAKSISKIIHQQLQKARQDWLREEIVKLENEKVSVRDCERCNNCETATSTCERIIWGNTINEVLQTIIDRYLFELDQDNK